ncbi:MAG: tRNA dimethylallyltransferase [Syntrophus sp. SKADARSKE-3]|nr:tRNA dimethylallyltransferase [Syntrophus sp. SKADARSKE-3]
MNLYCRVDEAKRIHRKVEQPKPRLIVIAGPTAVGKTALALEMAESFGGEIVNADSMQVYRHMDIGTAKPSADERRRITHHLLDLVDPDESFNASLFTESAEPVIRSLHQKGIPIFVVGGTGLYIRALLGGLFSGPAADEELRKTYRAQLAIHGGDYLYNHLKLVDPLAARRIDLHDTARIIRALEVITLTGHSIVEKQAEHAFSDRHYDYLKIGLTMDRNNLFGRIDRRTRAMVEAGLVDEVRRLLQMGYGKDIKPIQSMGYKHIVSHLKGDLSIDEAITLTARDTRRYAKRQETWFRSEPDTVWFLPGDLKMIKENVKRFIRGDDPEIA